MPASLSITNSQSSLRLTSIESGMPPAISSSVVPFFSCPQSLPASESFPMSPQLGIVFALALSLHSFWSYFSTDPQQHIGHLLTWEVPLSVSYHFAFHTVHGVLKARILKWFAIPFSTGPHSVRPLHHDPPVLGCPTSMAWFH